jgi:hypothetical protein
MADFEFFKKEFEFKGKHAKMAQELWVRDDTERTYFKRLIDLYVAAAVVGFRVDRKAEEDYSPFETSSIFPEQMLKEKENLDFILQMMIMLNYRGTLTEPGKNSPYRDRSVEENLDEECVKKAFQGAQTKEEFEQYKKMFNDYVRGGVEELYEQLIIRKADPDDKFRDNRTANLMALMTRYGAGKMNVIPENEDETVRIQI